MATTDEKLVLLVDDNPAHQYSLRRHLESAGFRVLEAGSGAEALALAKEQLPAVVLLDIHLPDVTGFDVCRQLKADGETRTIPVIFHSATHDTQDAKSLATSVGGISFLSYPIDLEHLFSVLRGAILRTRQSPPNGD